MVHVFSMLYAPNPRSRRERICNRRKFLGIYGLLRQRVENKMFASGTFRAGLVDSFFSFLNAFHDFYTHRRIVRLPLEDLVCSIAIRGRSHFVPFSFSSRIETASLRAPKRNLRIAIHLVGHLFQVFIGRQLSEVPRTHTSFSFAHNLLPLDDSLQFLSSFCHWFPFPRSLTRPSSRAMRNCRTATRSAWRCPSGFDYRRYRCC